MPRGDTSLDVGRKTSLVQRDTLEVVTTEELEDLFETRSSPKAYWGFEISGPVHIGTGLICVSKIKDCVEAGMDFTVYLADLHSVINQKLGGDMELIRRAGEYFKEAFTALGLSEDDVTYVWASELAQEFDYWDTVLQVARNATLNRVKRALPIMGREITPEDVETAFLFYPCMQVADIFQMDLDVVCAGIDQRKAHMLARDVSENIEKKKPVAVHTPLLPGLTRSGARMDFDEDLAVSRQISSKMSKSKPSSVITIHDTPERIREKVRGAYCPPKQVEDNPVLQLAQLLVFPRMQEMKIERPKKYGGDTTYSQYGELEDEYVQGELHPQDLKNGLAEALIELLEPVREYFEENPEPLGVLDQMEVTR